MLTWSVSNEALADWFTEEQGMVASAVADAATGPLDSHQAEKTCNHGCHAASHIQGQVATSISFFSPGTELPFILDESFFLPPGIAQRQFRPPRQTFQA